MSLRGAVLFGLMGLALLGVAVFQSTNVALAILNLCLISGIMALGVNVQWGYAGLFNVGTMGFAALGGLAAVVVSMPSVGDAWSAGGGGVLASGALLAILVAAVIAIRRALRPPKRLWVTIALILIGIWAIAGVFGPATKAIEAIDPAATGYLGGLGLPIVLSWAVGGVFAAGAAWVIGKVALGLRSDYLAIATLGISEIIVTTLKNEDWLARGVKNVTGMPRPVPYEVDLIAKEWVQNLAEANMVEVAVVASIIVKLSYTALILLVLIVLLWFAERALASPWGRMMRAIRDNRDAAAAMGKNVTARHLQVFVLGSAICGIAGAMLVTLDGQFTPTSYIPLRYTFLIWVMVILGGSGNNWGSVLGGFVIWFTWVEAEPFGLWVMELVTSELQETSPLRRHLIEAAPQMRLVLMGLVLLVVMRFAPRGLLPERSGN